MDFDLLPPSDSTLLRMTATSGLRTAYVQSPLFSVPVREPLLQTTAPATKLSVPAGVPFALRATLSTSLGHDGQPFAQTPMWSSDREGPIGSGFRRSTRLLASGVHTLSAELKGASAAIIASTTVMVRRAVEAFVHVATPDTVAGNSTSLYLFKIPQSAVVHVTKLSNSDKDPLDFDNHQIGVWWDGATWAIFNQDMANMSVGASFLIAVQRTAPTALLSARPLTMF